VSALHDKALQVQWGFDKKAVTMKPDGVLALAAEWVREQTEEHRIAPGVRDVHYALISLCAERGLVYPNTLSAYTSLGRYTAALRRAGSFPPLSDDSRSLDLVYADKDAKDALRSAIDLFKLDHTLGQEVQTWVAVEKRGLRARVRQWLGGYGLPIIPMGGFTSEAIERQVSYRIFNDGRPAVLLVLSDFDPSGLLLPDKFIEHVGLFVHVERVALTAEQIDRLDLPEDPAPVNDSRLGWFIEQTGRSVQVEVNALLALHPGELQRLLLDAVGKFWDEDAAAATREREAEERRWLRIARVRLWQERRAS
jgi:hypothetical protein